MTPYLVAIATTGDEVDVVDIVDVVTEIAPVEANNLGVVDGVRLSVWAHRASESGRAAAPIVRVELTRGGTLTLIADLLNAVRSIEEDR